MREIKKQLRTCIRCSNEYWGQANAKYCIDCKVDVMNENSRKNYNKNKLTIEQKRKDRKIIMKGL